MQQEETISIHEFCIHHHIDVSFIRSLSDAGLIEIMGADESYCISADQLTKKKKMARLHYNLDINLAGIESITHLLSRMEKMQQQMIELHNRLLVYEEINQAV